MKTHYSHYLKPSDRPESLQSSINMAFEELSKSNNSNWTLNGSPSYFHFSVEETYVLLNLIKSNPTQKEFSVLDVGAGDFPLGLGRNMANFINEHIASGDIVNDIMFNIISIRGEGNLHKPDTKLGNCNIYELGEFKIENLIEELNNKGLNDIVTNKFDFIVSNFCLVHLVDPLTTFIQMYDVLKNSGIMFTDTFDFKLQILSEDYDSINQTISKHYVYKIIPYIYQSSDNQDQILLKYPSEAGMPKIAIQKHTDNMLQIPYTYNEDVYNGSISNSIHYISKYNINKTDVIPDIPEHLATFIDSDRRVVSYTNYGKIIGNFELFKTLAKSLLLQEEDYLNKSLLLQQENKLQIYLKEMEPYFGSNEYVEEQKYINMLQDSMKCTKECINHDDIYKTGGCHDIGPLSNIIFDPDSAKVFDDIKLIVSGDIL